MKKIISFLLIFILMFTLVSCGNKYGVSDSRAKSDLNTESMYKDTITSLKITGKGMFSDEDFLYLNCDVSIKDNDYSGFDVVEMTYVKDDNGKWKYNGYTTLSSN